MLPCTYLRASEHDRFEISCNSVVTCTDDVVGFKNSTRLTWKLKFDCNSTSHQSGMEELHALYQLKLTPSRPNSSVRAPVHTHDTLNIA